MKKLKRKFLRFALEWAKLFHSRKYMKVYNAFLMETGMDTEGKIKFIHSSAYIDTAYASKIHVGENVVISVNTIILAHDFSLECGMSAIGLGNPADEKKIVQDVYIGNNVFIGAGCIVLPGTHIGDNCIIGAGTVCSGIIPEDSVVVGEKWKRISSTSEWAKKKQHMLKIM